MNTNRFSDTCNSSACPRCKQSRVLVWQNNRRCLTCGIWLENDQHMGTYYVVTRALNILLNNDFRCEGLTNEVVLASGQMVDQQRLTFAWKLEPHHFEDHTINCSIRWYKLEKKADYQYLHKVKRKVVVTHRDVPAAVQKASAQLAIAGSAPGSLRFTETNLENDQQLSKYVRMEQSYAIDEATAHDTSLILRVEFSWQKHPALTTQPDGPHNDYAEPGLSQSAPQDY